MILKYTLILSVILFSGCSNLNTKTQISSDKSLPQADKDILEIAVNLQGIASEDVWPGFSNFSTSVVYFTTNEQFLLNPKGQVPSEYLTTNLQGPSWSNSVYVAKNWVHSGWSYLHKKRSR